MNFFIAFFNKNFLRPYIKFNLNIFFLKHSLSLVYNHFLNIHFFLPTRYLKVKILKNTRFYTQLFYQVLLFTFVIVFMLLFLY